MKKVLLFLFVFSTILMSCNKEEWGNNNSDMEHVYYYGLCNEAFPGGNEKIYTVSEGNIVEIPTQFFSVFERSYSPEVYYYTSPIVNENDEFSSQLQLDVDYIVTDSKGNKLEANENGSYTMIWPNAKGGKQNIYIKSLSNKKGSIKVLTFDPNKIMNNMDVESTVIIRTGQYEVRAFTENYFVTLKVN